MPIKPELRKFYGRTWRTIIRPRILERAGNRCELCGVPNGVTVWRLGRRWMKTRKVRWGNAHLVRIVLTIAHLNHTPGDDRDENLKALCQWCHLNLDKHHHAESRAARKDQSRPILTALTSANG